MLTETKFQELYAEALQARNRDDAAGARKRLLYLFDYGRTVGGFGVVRLSYVLEELGQLAEPGNPQRGQEAAQGLADLRERRDARERLALNGQAGFEELQELVYINKALEDPGRSAALYQELGRREAARPDLAPVRRTLGDLLASEALFAADPEALALEYELQKLQRRLVELRDGVRAALDAPASAAGLALLARDLRRQIDRFRVLDPATQPPQKRRLVELARQAWALLERHPMPAGDLATDRARTALDRLLQATEGLLAAWEIRGELLRDQEIRQAIARLARTTAELICQCRLEQDFPMMGLSPPAGFESAIEVQVQRGGLSAYEALLRIGEDGPAEKLASWLLSFRQDGDMYDDLIDAARRAGRGNVEARLQDEARRLAL